MFKENFCRFATVFQRLGARCITTRLSNAKTTVSHPSLRNTSTHQSSNITLGFDGNIKMTLCCAYNLLSHIGLFFKFKQSHDPEDSWTPQNMFLCFLSRHKKGVPWVKTVGFNCPFARGKIHIKIHRLLYPWSDWHSPLNNNSRRHYPYNTKCAMVPFVMSCLISNWMLNGNNLDN